jgi:hypothetical protein
MKRFLAAVALTCTLSASTLAGEMHTTGAPALGDIPTVGLTSPGQIPSDGSTSPGDIPTVGLSVVLTILDLAF